MIFRFPVIIWPAAGYINLESLQSHDSGEYEYKSKNSIFLRWSCDDAKSLQEALCASWNISSAH